MSRRWTLVFASIVLAVAASCNNQVGPESSTSGPANKIDPYKENGSFVGQVKVEPKAKEATSSEPKAKEDSQAAATKTMSKDEIEQILQKVAKLYKESTTVQVRVKMATAVKGPGMENNATQEQTIAVQRPNKVAVSSNSGLMGINLVSDGQKLTTYIATLKKYSETAAPESIDQLLNENPLMGGGGAQMFALQLLGDNPYERMMEGVTSVQYAGKEEIGRTPVHRFKFTQEDFDWELFVNADGPPLVRRVTTDMSKAVSRAAAAYAGKDMKVTISEDFEDWKLGEALPENTFAFTPPEGATKAGDLFGSIAAEKELSPLLGQPAPDFDLELMGGGRVKLNQHKGKEIVMLDFWTTWCGPCRRSMPAVAGVANAYKDKGVVLYAVNQSEGSEEIEEFLKKEKLNVTVALDSDGSVGDRYGADAIPHFVVIDKTGVVQVVHQGFSPSLKTTLSRQLDDLLAGKNLAAEAVAESKAKAEKRKTEIPKPQGFELAWTAAGAYWGVAFDPEKQQVFASTRGKCDVFDLAGKKLRAFEIPAEGQSIRFAKLTGQDSGQLVCFRTWGKSAFAIAADGQVLWESTGGQGIDDVWPADLDGDGRDEVIVGYNGATGVHVFDFDGVPRWKNPDLGNVWHVCAGDVNGDGKMDVVSTSAQGKVHLFDDKGAMTKTLDPGLYANMVRVAKLGNNAAATIFTAGSGDDRETLVALDNEEKVLWKLDLSSEHVDSLALNPQRQWGAIGLRGGVVHVVDLSNGKIIATVHDQGQRPEVTWCTSDSPLVLVATGKAIVAYRVQPATPQP